MAPQVPLRGSLLGFQLPFDAIHSDTGGTLDRLGWPVFPKQGSTEQPHTGDAASREECLPKTNSWRAPRTPGANTCFPFGPGLRQVQGQRSEALEGWLRGAWRNGLGWKQQGHPRAQPLQPNAAGARKGCRSASQPASLDASQQPRQPRGQAARGSEGRLGSLRLAKEALSRSHAEDGAPGGRLCD